MFEIVRENGSRDRKFVPYREKLERERERERERDRETERERQRETERERLCSILGGNFKGRNILFEIKRYSR